MRIRDYGIEKGSVRTKNSQMTSKTDRFLPLNHLNYVTWITKILNFGTGQIVCVSTYEYSCVELGKILVLCKKNLRALQGITN